MRVAPRASFIPYITLCADLVPPRGNAPRSYWYLSTDYEEVFEKSRQLREAGDHDAWNMWLAERKSHVRISREKAAPLVEWVEGREAEYKAELRSVRETRRIEIEDRLIELGWELVDIQDGEYYSEKWKSLVGKTKPLDEKEWDDMLPHLLHGLNKVRQKRLNNEAKQRQFDRLRIIDDWLRSSSDAQVCITLKWADSSIPTTSGSVEAPTNHKNVKKCVRDVTIKVSSYPSSGYLLKSGQSYLEALLDQDRSAEEFELEFRGKRTDLRKQMFMGWRPNLEAALVKRLPENLAPANIESPDFSLRAHVGSKNPNILDNRLSLDLRKLLRADVRFMCHGRAVYYPEGFDTWTANKSSSTFDPVSSAIAKALLGPLQRPDASYLEMQALGASFVCGRCSWEPTYHTWHDIVEHYLSEYAWWKKACTRNARFSQGGEEITLVFTHDIHKIDHTKPLVNLVTERESRPNTPRRASTSNCKLCSRIGHYYGAEAAHITRHLQEVHLVESPILGEHYTESVGWW
ncbi:unnamed protein product [Rhizoctonia solani]|uniref:Uncharacterized protein n=1 Tax=Rhizoctonia solani TaxID=456999 RepID=A0A8H3GDE9_9AGAM|nr:unnamed protein product [Rhizoctonia solani]